MSDIDPEDIRAVRQQEGGLRSLLRAQIDIGKARRDKPVAAKAPPPPGYRPGAWPTGTRSPGPAPPQPPGAWTEALNEYRAYIAATDYEDRLAPAPSPPCQCPPCTAPRRNP